MKMFIFNTILVSLLAVFAISEALILKPCPVEDVECLNESTQLFLKHTGDGIPEHNIKTLDPVKEPALHISNEDGAVYYNLTDITVTGLGKQNISKFVLDREKKTVNFSTSANLTVHGNISATLRTHKYEGQVTLTGGIVGIMQYTYELVKNAEGAEHFVVGPETIFCDIKDDPEANFKPELPKELGSAERAELKALCKKGYCRLVKKLYPIVVHNIRVAAKFYPKTAFFTNM